MRHLLSVSSPLRAGCVVALTLAAVACDAPSRDSAPSSRVRVAIADSGVSRIALVAPVLDERDRSSVLPGEGPDDNKGHGTKLASLVRLHAPHAELVSIKAMGLGGRLTDEHLAGAVERAIELRARIVLLAMSGAAPLPLTRAAIAEAGRAGVLVVVAAGNDGLDLDRYPAYPAVYDEPNVVTVAATNGAERLLASSNRSTAALAMASGLAAQTCDWDGTPATIGGTSAASALVAAHAAELLATRRLTMSELRAELLAGKIVPHAAAARVGCE